MAFLATDAVNRPSAALFSLPTPEERIVADAVGGGSSQLLALVLAQQVALRALQADLRAAEREIQTLREASLGRREVTLGGFDLVARRTGAIWNVVSRNPLFQWEGETPLTTYKFDPAQTFTVIGMRVPNQLDAENQTMVLRVYQSGSGGLAFGSSPNIFWLVPSRCESLADKGAREQEARTFFNSLV